MDSNHRPHSSRLLERVAFVQTTKASSVKVRFDRKVLYELDGGDRKPVKALDVEIEPAAITVCVPADAEAA